MKKYVLIKRFGNVLETEEFTSLTVAQHAFNAISFECLLSGMYVVSVRNTSIKNANGILFEVVYQLGEVTFAFRLDEVNA